MAHVPPRDFHFWALPWRSPDLPNNTRKPAEHWLIGKGGGSTSRKRRLSRGWPTYPPGISILDPAVASPGSSQQYQKTRRALVNWKRRGSTSRKRRLSRGWPTYPPARKPAEHWLIGKGGGLRPESDDCLEDGPRAPPTISISGPCRGDPGNLPLESWSARKPDHVSQKHIIRELAAISGPCACFRGFFSGFSIEGGDTCSGIRQRTATRQRAPRPGHGHQDRRHSTDRHTHTHTENSLASRGQGSGILNHGALLGLGRMQRKSTLKHRKIQKDEAAKACATASRLLF